MVDMTLRQYRFFVYSLRDWHTNYDMVVARLPEAKVLFRQDRLYDDPLMFCHEAAHSMEFVRKGQYKRLCLPDYGWPPLQSSGWSKKMAENEARVFAQQELLAEHFKFKRDSDLLRPDTAGMFLAYVTGDRYAGKKYEDLILQKKEELRDDCMEVFDNFIRFLVQNVDLPAVAV